MDALPNSTYQDFKIIRFCFHFSVFQNFKISRCCHHFCNSRFQDLKIFCDFVIIFCFSRFQAFVIVYLCLNFKILLQFGCISRFQVFQDFKIFFVLKYKLHFNLHAFGDKSQVLLPRASENMPVKM